MGAQNRVSTHLSEKNTSVYEKNTVHPEKLLKKTHEINYQNPSFFSFSSVIIRKSNAYRLFVRDEENKSRAV